MSAKPPALHPIPAPLRRRWREFRILILPWIAFVLLAGMVALLWKDVIAPEIAPVVPKGDLPSPVQESPSERTSLAEHPLHRASHGTNRVAPHPDSPTD
jgi:hypothetical protein